LVALICATAALAVSARSVTQERELLLTPWAIRNRVHEKIGKIDTGKNYQSKVVREAIYTQWLDHFDLDDPTTFDQTIYINDEYYAPGGPVFIFVTAYLDNWPYWLENSWITHIAAQENGVIYAIEPRYNGQNTPTEDLSDENLIKYLAINQTVSDVADFVAYLRPQLEIYGSDKFVLFGYDTGATIAAWVHQSRIGLVDGVWAVGGPMIAVYEFQSYFADIAETLAGVVSEECGALITTAFTELDVVVESGDSERFSEIFQLYEILDITNTQDLGVFYYTLAQIIGAHVEYGSITEVNHFCTEALQLEGDSALEKLGGYFGSILAGGIFDYSAAVEVLKEDSWDSPAAISHSRQYYHLACRQWSWFRTSSLLEDFIANKFPDSLFASLCNDVFGVSRDEIIEGNVRTNNEYTVRVSLQNIYFTNGGWDPVRLAGITSDLNGLSPADVIPGIGKLFELRRDLPGDYLTDEMISVRSRVHSLINLWTA
jgi:pimeloyl-ACP methyl ester carboxylesterase